eukprot:5709418-Pleurochrysis_carterae.AAC.1
MWSRPTFIGADVSRAERRSEEALRAGTTRCHHHHHHHHRHQDNNQQHGVIQRLERRDQGSRACVVNECIHGNDACSECVRTCVRVRACVRVRTRARVRACARVYVCVRVRARMRAYACVSPSGCVPLAFAELRLVDDDDKLLGADLDHLLAQQRAAAALDQVEVRINLTMATARNLPSFP